MTPFYEDESVSVFHGDCREVMDGLEPESVDAVVTDPPYELRFMGQSWDGTGVAYLPETWAAALRVLKPGGHLLAFGGTRTFHRMTVAIEDAGFEVRDCLSWLYGSGFPKSLDVSKAIDKAAGAEREVVGRYNSDRNWRGSADPDDARYEGRGDVIGGSRQGHIPVGTRMRDITAPGTPEAAQWEGWGTALKPAWEPIVLARKPLQGTVAGNVLAWGTGALNIDGTRIPTDDRFGGGAKATSGFVDGYEHDGWKAGSEAGRWPANVVLDDDAATTLDQQSGDAPPSERTGRKEYQAGIYGPNRQPGDEWGYTDSGGASRFFYTAKASKADRGEGNNHPTVKPVSLMRWLVRMVTPPGGLILDPFAGSGTTAEAAIIEGFRATLIEAHEPYLPIIERRLRRPMQPGMFGGAA